MVHERFPVDARDATGHVGDLAAHVGIRGELVYQLGLSDVRRFEVFGDRVPAAGGRSLPERTAAATMPIAHHAPWPQAPRMVPAASADLEGMGTQDANGVFFAE